MAKAATVQEYQFEVPSVGLVPESVLSADNIRRGLIQAALSTLCGRASANLGSEVRKAWGARRDGSLDLDKADRAKAAEYMAEAGVENGGMDEDTLEAVLGVLMPRAEVARYEGILRGEFGRRSPPGRPKTLESYAYDIAEAQLARSPGVQSGKVDWPTEGKGATAHRRAIVDRFRAQNPDWWSRIMEEAEAEKARVEERLAGGTELDTSALEGMTFTPGEDDDDEPEDDPEDDESEEEEQE